uniref:Uncharacterized protein n=1 Tax=Rhizophora mucronata TaxID=61149 RepID=A0A2P2IMG4_RHIMU
MIRIFYCDIEVIGSSCENSLIVKTMLELHIFDPSEDLAV